MWGGLGSNVKLFKSAAYEVLPEPEPAFRFVGSESELSPFKDQLTVPA